MKPFCGAKSDFGEGGRNWLLGRRATNRGEGHRLRSGVDVLVVKGRMGRENED